MAMWHGGGKSSANSKWFHRSLQLEALERRDLLSIIPGFYFSGLVGRDSRLYDLEIDEDFGQLWAAPVAELITRDGNLASPAQDFAVYPGYAYTGYWDKQVLDVADHPTNPHSLPGVLRSWDVNAVLENPETEEADLLRIPVRVIGELYMDNPAYPASGQPKFLSVRANALEWSPELPDGTRILFGAGYAGVAGESRIRGHYLFTVDHRYAKVKPVVDLGALRVESAGDIAFGLDGKLYLSLRGGKLLEVAHWATPSPTVVVRTISGVAEDFDSLFPFTTQTLVGVARDGSWCEVSPATGRIVSGGEINLYERFGPEGEDNELHIAITSEAREFLGGALATRKPDDLGVISGTVSRNSVRPYLFQRWFQLDASRDGTLRVWATGEGSGDVAFRLYQQRDGGPLVEVASYTPWSGDPARELRYDRVKADGSSDYEYFVLVDGFSNPVNLRFQVIPGGPWPDIRLGALGDMLSQEYFEIGVAPALSWYEALVQAGRIDGGDTGLFSGIRWQGYEHNWATNWANLWSAPFNGQLSEVRKYAAGGILTHVFLSLGTTDYFHYADAYREIYWGTWTKGQIDEFHNEQLSSLVTIFERLQSTATPLLVSTVIDPGVAPHIQLGYPDAARRERVTQAIRQFNERLINLAFEYGVPVVDSFRFFKDFFGEHQSPVPVRWIGGVPIYATSSLDPHSAFTVNGICPGTVVSALWGNVILEGLRLAFHTTSAPLRDREILNLAGLLSEYDANGPSLPIDYASYILLPPLVSTENAIAGRVWNDRNHDGIQDRGEPGFAGVTLHLIQPGVDNQYGTEDDQVRATTVSGADGFYRFEALRDGRYFVRVELPAGYSLSPYRVGDQLDRDSDIVPILGITPPIEVEGGELVESVDVGLTRRAPSPPTDLGRLEYREFLSRAPRNEQLYYQFSNARAGLVSVALQTASEDAVLILLDAYGRLLNVKPGSGQLDYEAQHPGQVFQVLACGVGGPSDLVIGNLVQQSGDGSTVTIFGTSSRDRVQFAVAPEPTVQINRLLYRAGRDQILRQVIYLGSRDLVEVVGTPDSDSLNLTPGRARGSFPWNGSTIDLRLDNWGGSFSVDLGAGIDVLRIGNAPAEARETLILSPTEVRWRNGDFSHVVLGAENVLAVAGNGATDSAWIYDGPNDDTVEAGPGNPRATRHLAAIQGTTAEGNPFILAVRGYERVFIEAVNGGNDHAEVYDTPLDSDRVFVDPVNTSLFTPGGRQIQAKAFETVSLRGTLGDADRAYVTGSEGNDTFWAEDANSVIFWNGDRSHRAELWGFSAVNVRGNGGVDAARLALGQAEGEYRFRGSIASQEAQLHGPGFRYDLVTFSEVFVGPTDSVATSHRILPNASATLSGGPGNDDFILFHNEEGIFAAFDGFVPPRRGIFDELRGAVRYGVRNFAHVSAFATGGGEDYAYLLGSPYEVNRLTVTPEYAVLRGAVYQCRVAGFDRYLALAEPDDFDDQAILYDSPYNDSLVVGQTDVWPFPALILNYGTPQPVVVNVAGFNRMTVLSGEYGFGGSDSAHWFTVNGWHERFFASAAWRTLGMTTSDPEYGTIRWNLFGIRQATITGSPLSEPADQALLMDSPGDDWLSADGAEFPRRLLFAATDFLLTFENLAEITAISFFGGEDTREIYHRDLLEFVLNDVGNWQDP